MFAALLFMPFDRLGAEQTDVQGTGLGLALSRGLMEAMGGTLTATSVVGGGTTFTLDLALADEPVDERDEPAAEPLARGRAGTPSTPSCSSRTTRPTCAWSSGCWPGGAAEYLTKPLDVPRFLDVIDGILVAARP